MNKWILILLLLPCVSAQVLISEVLYNPINTESGGEAIELYNPTNQTIDISNWIIATETSDHDAQLPSNTTILARGYLLIADNGFSLNKDNSSWPNSNYEETITLKNSNDGIALKNGSIIVDAVGWGLISEIKIGLFQRTPHPGTDEGKSLQRINNTGNNSVDFISGVPDLKNKTIELNQTRMLNESVEDISNSSINLTNNISLELSDIPIINLFSNNKTRINFSIKNIGLKNITIEFNQTYYFENNSIQFNFSNNNFSLNINQSINLSLEIIINNITGEYFQQIELFAYK